MCVDLKYSSYACGLNKGGDFKESQRLPTCWWVFFLNSVLGEHHC